MLVYLHHSRYPIDAKTFNSIVIYFTVVALRKICNEKVDYYIDKYRLTHACALLLAKSERSYIDRV